ALRGFKKIWYNITSQERFQTHIQDVVVLRVLGTRLHIFFLKWFDPIFNLRLNLENVKIF
mgnify:CR=1